MTNIAKQRIFLLLTFRLLGNIHFQEKPLQFLQLFVSLLQRVWGFGLFYVEPIHCLKHDNRLCISLENFYFLFNKQCFSDATIHFVCGL